MTTPATLLSDTSLADELGHADPYKNLMGHIEANDEWRKEHPETVDAIFKTEEKTGAINLLRSAGPVSDAFITNTHGISALCGPVGSGKTIASVKKGLVEAQRIFPGADGVRNYKLGCVTQKYDNQWKATIPSHWKIFRKDMPGSSWSGASPRQAQHILRFEDAFGPIRMVKDFFSFGEDANEEDLRGLEYTDIELIELDTLPHKLLVGLGRAVGREPPKEIIRRTGRRWGALNAPTTQNWVYKFFLGGVPTALQTVHAAGRHGSCCGKSRRARRRSCLLRADHRGKLERSILRAPHGACDPWPDPRDRHGL